MKKFLSTVLCLCMIISILPLQAVTATEVDAETDTATLEKFGFAPDESTYDTEGLKPGKHILNQGYDLYADRGIDFEKWEYSKEVDSENAMINAKKAANYSISKSHAYFATTAFDPTGCKADNYVARVYLEDYMSGGRVMLHVFDANGNVVIDSFATNGRISTATDINVWDMEGLVSIDAGDFDGDGKEELAVYVPNNYIETKSGSVSAEFYVDIFKIDVENKSVTTTQYINLSSLLGNEICEWEYTYKGDAKRYYCIPYVALTADDLNGDGIDDLMATVNFSTYYRGVGYKTKYTTADLLNHNKYFTSVLEVYEGTKGGQLTQTVRHKMLLTNNIDGYRYVLRNANAVVADVTADGSREIVIGGNYTRVKYKSTTSSDTVNENRGVWIDDEDAAKNIVGFTTYENLKKYDPATSDSAYKWTPTDCGNPTLHYYESDDEDPVAEPVSLCGYQFKGIGQPDMIFLEGQQFRYDTGSGKLIESFDCYIAELSKKSNVWIGKAVAANLGNDMFYKEVLVFPVGYKTSGKDIYTYRLESQYNITAKNQSDSSTIFGSETKTTMSDVQGKCHVSLALVDNGTKSTYIEYDKGNTDIYYSDIDLLAIMQAPPVYEELNDDSYIGNSQTSFAKSSGTGTGSSLGGSLTAGVVAGFEQETSFLGLFKCAGAEYELKVTGTVSYDDSTETSYDYSTGFATSGTTDAVAIFTVPYVRYNCTMYMPEYTLPTQADYTELCAFRDELKKNLEKYASTSQDQINGTYSGGCKYYYYIYKSKVTSDNYQSQLEVYSNVVSQIDAIEKAVASLGKGGKYSWGEVVPSAVLPYKYSIPQNPMVTTMDVQTYDALAETSGYEKISDKVFGENYVAGDPSTYAHDTSDLNVSSGFLTAKTNTGSSGDGFLSNSTGSSSATSQSQTISVEKSNSKTLGWGAAQEATLVANAGGAMAGITASAEINGSSVWTTTEGNEYSATVVDLPSGTPADYAYGWKLVAYNTKINNSEVPVVGYLTKLTTTPPPSIAQSISIENVTDKAVTITWEDGHRKADYYKISRVAYDASGDEQYYPLSGTIKSVNGKCSYTLNNLQPSNTSYYVIEAYTQSGKKSVASQIISVTTLPDGFAVILSINGVEEDVIYRDGKEISAKLNIVGNEKYDTYYQWQIDKGNGWEDIENADGKSYNFKISAADNQRKIRCRAAIFINNRSWEVYSNPITLNCTSSQNGYNVDWSSDGKSVTVTSKEGATPANIYLKAENANGISKIMYEPSSANGVTFNTSDVADNDITLYIWENNLAPVTYPFVR